MIIQNLFKIIYIFLIINNISIFINCQLTDNNQINEPSSTQISSSSSSSSSSYDTLIDIPEELNKIPFLCYGNTKNQSSYLLNNTFIYKPYPVITNNSISFIPNNCTFLYDNSDQKKLSCCLNSNKEAYNNIINYIWSNQVNGNLIDCITNKTLEGGFKIVEEDGTTPDLVINTKSYNIFTNGNTNSETLDKLDSIGNDTNENGSDGNNGGNNNALFVYDTRESVKTCLSHLSNIQCYKCSQDLTTLLRDLDPNIGWLLNKESRLPLFFQQTDTTIENDYVNGTIIKNNITHGKPISLCNNYFNTLMQHCQYVSIGGIPINKLYKSVSGQTVFRSPKVGKFGISVAPLQEFSYVSIDKTDSLYVSNYNCFQLPIIDFKEPKRCLILNKKWYTDKDSSETSHSLSTKSINFTYLIIIILTITITTIII